MDFIPVSRFQPMVQQPMSAALVRRLLEHGLDPNLLTGEVTLPPDYGAAPSRRGPRRKPMR